MALFTTGDRDAGPTRRERMPGAARALGGARPVLVAALLVLSSLPGCSHESTAHVLRQPALAGWTAAETEHFRFHFPPDTQVRDVAAYTEQREEAFERIAEFFQPALPGKIDFFVWSDGDAARALFGMPLGFARPAQLQIQSRDNQTRGHEITHVIVHYSIAVHRSSKFISEGTAVAFDQTNRDRMAVARAAVEKAVDEPISVTWLWRRGYDLGGMLYPVGGAFVDALITWGGRARFLAFLSDQTVEHARVVYGPELDGMICDFDAALNAGLGTSPDACLEQRPADDR